MPIWVAIFGVMSLLTGICLGVRFHSNQSCYQIGTKQQQKQTKKKKQKKKQKKKNTILSLIDAIYEIWRESASWLQRRCRLKSLTMDDDDGRTDDGCLAIL